MDHLEWERNRGQKDRIDCWELRLEVLEKLNTTELIKEFGFRTYWNDNRTHYLPRLIPTKSERGLDNQISFWVESGQE
jgi:hypothetical protein